ETVSADFHTMFSDGRSDFDGFMSVPPFSPADSAQFSETQDLVSYLGVKIAAPHSRWTHRLGYAYTDTDSENFDPAQAITTRTFVSEGRNKRVEYVGSFAFSPTYT